MPSEKTASEHRDLWMYFVTTTRPLETKDTDKIECLNMIKFLGAANIKFNKVVADRLEQETTGEVQE